MWHEDLRIFIQHVQALLRGKQAIVMSAYPMAPSSDLAILPAVRVLGGRVTLQGVLKS